MTPTPTCQPSTHAHNSYYYIRCPSTASGLRPILDTTTRPKLGSAKWLLCCPKIPLGKENPLYFLSAWCLATIALASLSFLSVKCYGLPLWILWVNTRNEYGWDTHSPCSSMVVPLVSFNLAISCLTGLCSNTSYFNLGIVLLDLQRSEEALPLVETAAQLSLDGEWWKSKKEMPNSRLTVRGVKKTNEIYKGKKPRTKWSELCKDRTSEIRCDDMHAKCAWSWVKEFSILWYMCTLCVIEIRDDCIVLPVCADLYIYTARFVGIFSSILGASGDWSAPSSEAAATVSNQV